MILGGDAFFLQLALFRQCWIKGRLGGGKTLLAFALAWELVKRKVCKGVVSNVPNSLPLQPWREPMGDGHRLIRGAAVVYDEAWVKLDNRTSVTNDRTYGAFSRKLDVMILFPSVIPIDKRQSYLSCQRVFRFKVPLISGLVAWIVGAARRGVELAIEKKNPRKNWAWAVVRKVFGPLEWLGEEFWAYRWAVELGYMTDTGIFWLVKPSAYFGIYDTKHIPLDDGDIGALWERTIMEEVKNDVGTGQWYIEVEQDDAGQEREYIEKGPGYVEDEIDRYLSARAGGDNTAKIRSIAYPFSDRPVAQVDTNDY
jgi:hypothetical protein